LVKFFNVEKKNIKIWLAVVLFISSIGFILSSIIAHYSGNVFTRALYSISSMWLAVGWNLIMAFSVSWIVILISKAIGRNLDYKRLAVVSLVFTFVFSIYGIWSASSPKVKKVTVGIKNLPEEWKGKKAVQLSDIHLGHIYGKKFLVSIVEKVNTENPDIIFITGDLFDGMDGRLDPLVGPLNDIKAPDGTYFVTGNHETYLGVEHTHSVLKNTPVKILDNEVADISGMQVLGISYPQRGENSDIKNKIGEIKNFNSEKLSILLYHNPSEAKSAEEAGVDLQLAGHTHKGQLFPFQLITRLIYGKYHFGLSIDGDFSIYTSSGAGTWGPAMRTSGRSEIVVINFKHE
jgi:predicted MPP superfamily phosphohydrolase